MALKERKPTTSSLRGRVDLVREGISQKASLKSLLLPLKGSRGRSHGTVSTRHQKRGVKKYYRIIDFKRQRNDIKATVQSVEYDPNRNVNIALIAYVDGLKNYILAPKDMRVGDSVISGVNVPIKSGNALPLKSIPLGVSIHNIEIHKGRGGILARSAGVFAVVSSKEGEYANIKLPSGEVKKIHLECMASIGVLSNEDFKNTKIGKAGRRIHMGIRPTVRGVSYSNPRDHAHGGSYRTAGVGRSSPVSPTGVPAKGFKTKKRKKGDIYKVKDRRVK
ncbi:50S ribosomal protein L2 [Patescibacteria group bacterium]|nr:50S ribosomal protein L2 [Patescibacteria group bacterium]